jgi:hypothetical protein
MRNIYRLVLTTYDSKSAQGLQEGETVSWNWGSGHPHGRVKGVNGEERVIEARIANL